MQDMELSKHHIIDSGSNGYGMRYPRKGGKNILNIRHNAGFFSCSTIALQDIVIWHRQHNKLPDLVDRSHQYAHYKNTPLQNLIPFYFEETDIDIPFHEWYEISHDNRELQFSDYRKLDFVAAKPFIDKFFTPSQHVLDIVKMYEEKYQIDYENTCGVFYRGNDKNRETSIAPYESFINRALTVLENNWPYSTTDNPDSVRGKVQRFFVLPDEPGFWEGISNNFLCITPDELPMCYNKDSAMFFELPLSERAEYGAKFLAAVIVMSKCKHLITHSGNCGLWAVLYRGNADNVHQWLNDCWL